MYYEVWQCHSSRASQIIFLELQNFGQKNNFLIKNIPPFATETHRSYLHLPSPSLKIKKISFNPFTAGVEKEC